MNGPFTGEVLPRVDAPWLGLLPLVAALVAVALARWPHGRVARVLPWCSALPPALALAVAPAQGFLFVHYTNLLRLGFLELRLDAAVGRGTALAALACAVVGALRPSPRKAALVALALASLVVDDLLLAALGWGALVALSARGRGLAVVAAALAPVAVVLLFWGLGGGFTRDGYAPDLGARVVAVVAGDAKPVPESAFDDDDDDEVAVPQYAAGDHGTLAVRAFPGAELHLDGARAPSARSPLEARSLPAGFHAFRLHPGQAYDDYVVAQLRVDPGQRVVLVTAGSTTSAADARDQMQARLGEHAPFAESLAARHVFGAPLVGVVLVALALAALGALRGVLPGVVAVGLASSIVAIGGTSEPAALVAFVLAVPVALVSPRADVLLGVGAVLAGAPLPAALALVFASALGERRVAAVASLVPRAALIAAVSADGSALGRVALGALLAASVATLAAPRLRAASTSTTGAGWAAAFFTALVGASSFALVAPSVGALVVASVVTSAGIVPARAWARGRRRRLQVLGAVRRRGGVALRRVVASVDALEVDA